MYGIFDTTIEHEFEQKTVYKASTPTDPTFSVLHSKDVNFDNTITYANVYRRFSGNPNSTDRGHLFHTLTLLDNKYNTVENKWEYTFKIVGGSPDLQNGDTVTIQPCNRSLALKIANDYKYKQMTFKVNNKDLYKSGVIYVISSYCLDKYVEGVATCINTRVDSTHGPIVTFEFSDTEYEKYSQKDHCRFSFAEKGLFKNGEWLQFKKRKSFKNVKKRSKTPKRSKSSKNVKNVKNRANTPKRSKARKNVKSVKNVKNTKPHKL